MAAYAPLAAYAQLLAALGDAKAAAAAFEQALRVAPQSVPALAGRARALAAAGDDAAALAAYDDALKIEQRAPARRRLIDAALAILGPLGRGARQARAGQDNRRCSASSRAPSRSATRSRSAWQTRWNGPASPPQPPRSSRRGCRPGHAAAKLDLALRAARLRMASGDPADGQRVAAMLAALDSRAAAW